MSAVRGVAQPGSAPAWGVGGRWFKSSRPDHPEPFNFSFLLPYLRVIINSNLCIKESRLSVSKNLASIKCGIF